MRSGWASRALSSGESNLSLSVTLGFELLEFLAEGDELLGEALEFGFHVRADRHCRRCDGHFGGGAGAESIANHLINQFAGFAFGDLPFGGEFFDQLVGIGANFVAELLDRLLVALGILETFDRRGGCAKAQPKTLLRQLEDRFGGDVGGSVHKKSRLTEIADDVSRSYRKVRCLWGWSIELFGGVLDRVGLSYGDGRS
jgi:hypothetical protein